MNKKTSKQIDELRKATLIIKEMGYTPDINMCSDAPDILIPSHQNREIGIEVVDYSTRKYEEAESALHKILDEYIDEILDKKSDKRYEIGVFMKNLGVPIHINYKKQKKQLFQELNNLIFHETNSENMSYIEDIVLMENPGVPRSFISNDIVIEYRPLDESTLFECINQKELKLRNYRLRIENKKIKEYYLAIYFPMNEGAELRNYTLPGNFTTQYDRIYLVDDFYLNRIK